MSLAVKLVLAPVLVAQALRTRATLPRLPEAAGEREGVAGAAHSARVEGQSRALHLLVAGDSSAAGVGVDDQQHALAAPLAAELARLAATPVRWRLVAASGLGTADTLELLRREHAVRPLPRQDVAVVVSGVNDVVDQVRPRRALAARAAMVDWLRATLGMRHAVFAALPPLHAFPGLPQPLRWVAGGDARRHDQALERWTRARRDVSRVALALPLDARMMAVDGFHPGAAAYRRMAEAIARHIVQRVLPSMPP